MRKPGPLHYKAGSCDGKPVFEMANRAGYSALIASYDLAMPLPLAIFATGESHQEFKYARLHVLTPRHAPPPTLEGHLTFALKYEGVNPGVLKALFRIIERSEIEAMVRATPTSAYVRRIWFLYELLTGRRLDLPAVGRGTYVDALDASQQPVSRAVNSPRHRVRNNVPLTPDWCPGAA